MLTKRSSKSRLLKALVALPVAMCCVYFFSGNAYSFKKKEEKSNEVIFKGNRIEFSGPVGKGKQQEMTVTQEGKMETFDVTVFASPVKVNGKPIHSSGDVTKEPVFLGEDKSLSKYLFRKVQSDLGALPDGEYFIHIAYPVVDDKGKLVYYDMEGLTVPGTGRTIDNAIKRNVDSKLTAALDNAPSFAPAEIKGKKVNWYDAWAVELGYRVMVKDHKALLEYKQPQ